MKNQLLQIFIQTYKIIKNKVTLELNLLINNAKINKYLST